MKTTDYNVFHDSWINAHAMSSSNQIPANAVISAVFDLLSEYPLSIVQAAINLHSKQSRFAPTPADICEIINARSGEKHPGADEAWAIALESMDEAATVTLTREIVEARVIALPVWETGDEVAARMVFRDAYNRIIATAGKPAWFVSLGFDVQKRIDGIQKSVELGRLSQAQDKRYLPAPRDGGAIGKLLTGQVTEMPKNNAALRERWQELKQAMIDGQARLEERERQEREQKRLEFERRRETALRAVADKLQAISVDSHLPAMASGDR